jgi:hypothetical protein
LAGLQVVVDHGLRCIDIDQFRQCIADTIDEDIASLVQLHRVDALDNGGAPGFDRVVLGNVLCNPFVGEFGEFQNLDPLDGDREIG